jgi:hypothetical protein
MNNAIILSVTGHLSLLDLIIGDAWQGTPPVLCVVNSSKNNRTHLMQPALPI